MKIIKDIIVAIDGHASCGKSSLAKKLAQALQYSYIDTGAMYRAVALFCLENNIIKNRIIDEKKLINSLDKINITFQFDNILNKSITILNDINVENKIRTLEVSEYASPVATIAEVRTKLVLLQQEMGKNKRITMDGRDITTVVFPNADLKIFLTASEKVRAQRRYLELTEKGENVSFDEIYNSLITRDKRDTTRSVTPMYQTEDSILIDNSNLNAHETFIVVLSIISERYGDGVKF